MNPIESHKILKSRELSLPATGKISQSDLKGPDVPCWLEEGWRGPHTGTREIRLGAENDPQLTASKETRASVLQPQETEVCQESE